jgi:hypothetical protein
MRSLLARAGFFAMGAIYGAIGFVAARVAFLGARDRIAGMPGALRFILRQQHGPAVLRVVVAGLAGFTLWHLGEALRSRPRRGAIARFGHAAAAIGYAALVWTGVHLLLRLRGGSSVASRKGLAWLLSQSWGSSAITFVGLVVLAAAAGQLWQAWSGRLQERFRKLGRRGSRFVLAVARFGLASRGVVFAIVGWFVIRTARERDPSQFREIGGALTVLSRTQAGPWLMGIAGLGLLAFAFYMWTLALFRKA